MLSACWITKATNTRSEYVILIDFSPQQWLGERAVISRLGTLPLRLILKSVELTKLEEKKALLSCYMASSLHSAAAENFLNYVCGCRI